MLHAIDFFIDHLRLSDLQLVALTTHSLDEYREVQHATTRDDPLVGGILERLDTQGKVLLQFLLQAVVDMTRGNKLTLLTEERRVVDAEQHRHRRLVDGNRRQWLGILYVADGVANLELFESNDGTDIATVYLINARVSHTVEGMQLLNLRLLRRTVAMGNGDLHAVLQLATMYAAHGDTACIRTIVQRSDKHLGSTLNLLGSGNHLDNLIQQIGDIGSGFVVVLTHPTILGRAINHREIQLVFSSIQREHEIKHHLVDLLRATIGFIDLVDHHNGFQTNLQRLLQHETRLRHGAFEGVDEQQTAVGHVQYALHLATEVRVSRSVDNIDFRSFPVNTHILRKNGDAAFAFKVVSIQHLTRQVLSLTEKIACQHHLVHQRRLAVVYMCNNCNISDILHRNNLLFDDLQFTIYCTI